VEAFKEIQEAIKTACEDYNHESFRVYLRLPMVDSTSTLEEINKAITWSDPNAEEQTTTPNAWAVFLCIWDNQ
jgi:hypothetical protein